MRVRKPGGLDPPGLARNDFPASPFRSSARSPGTQRSRRSSCRAAAETFQTAGFAAIGSQATST